MGLFDAAAVAAALLALGVGVRYIDPAVLDRLARETGFDARIGWATYLLAVGVVVAPLAAGASIDGDGVWTAGSAVSAVGVYLLAVAASSVDEYRALGRAREVEVTPPRPGDEPVAVTGTPDPEADAVAPLSGMAAVHADWLVQERDRVGVRTTWRNRTGGVRAVPFELEGARVVPGGHRAFGGTTTILTVPPEESLPEGAADLFRAREDLPEPGKRSAPVRLIEEAVPSDTPVTVVGVPDRSEADVVIGRGPSGGHLGSGRVRPGTDVEYVGDADGPSEAPEPVLIDGDAATAGEQLARRVRWLGAAGAVMVVAGQALAVWLSAATVP